MNVGMRKFYGEYKTASFRLLFSFAGPACLRHYDLMNDYSKHSRTKIGMAGMLFFYWALLPRRDITYLVEASLKLKQTNKQNTK